MSKNRIYFLFLLFSFGSYFPTTAYESLNPNHAKQWSTVCSEQMTPEELQFTANFLLLLYANAYIDCSIEPFFAELSRLNQTIRRNLSDPTNPNTETTQLKALATKIAYTTQIRSLYTNMLDACLDYYDNNKTNITEQALNALQSYASESLYAWAAEEQETITHLESSAKIMADTAQSIHSASNLYKGLRNGIFPFMVEERDKHLAIFNVILKSTPLFIRAIDNTTNTLDTTCAHAMKIIGLGADVYKEHYQALYEVITSESFDGDYATTLFGDDGLLPEEYRVALPDTDHIFEHMLATTLFFSQIQS